MWLSDAFEGRFYDILNVGLVLGLILGLVVAALAVWTPYLKGGRFKRRTGTDT